MIKQINFQQQITQFKCNPTLTKTKQNNNTLHGYWLLLVTIFQYLKVDALTPGWTSKVISVLSRSLTWNLSMAGSRLTSSYRQRVCVCVCGGGQRLWVEGHSRQ